MRRAAAILAAALCLFLCGCASLLDRSYSTVEAHTSKLWDSEAAGTLRAETYQDVVNDLLILVGQHTENATLRLYDYEDDTSVADILEQAAAEVQQETPMGSYAVEYITSSSTSQRGYYEISIHISYRRTAEQIKAIVNASSTEALPDLLNAALDGGQAELAVRIGYWGEGLPAVEQIVAGVRESRGLADAAPWTVTCYPPSGTAGIVEFLLDGQAGAAAPADGAASSSAAAPAGGTASAAAAAPAGAGGPSEKAEENFPQKG